MRRPATASPLATLAVALLALLLLATACGSSTSATVKKIDPTTTTTTVAPSENSTTTTLEPEAGVGKLLYLYTPVIGDCIDHRTMTDGRASTTRSTPDQNATLRASGQVIVRLDCERPHQYEVIFVDTMDVAKSPPQSSEAFNELAKQVCPAQFSTAVGRPYQDSELEFGWITPTNDQQAQGIEFLGCLAFNPKGKLTESVRGSGR
jgi:hypothetical protein